MVVYISLRFETNIGAKVHRSILEELYGKENIFVFDLRAKERYESDRYVCYGKYRNNAQRIQRWLQGNSMYIDNKIIEDICRVIDENECELVFFENTNFGKLVKRIKEKFPNVKLISFYHDIDADLYQQWSVRSNLPGKIECAIGIRQEAITQKYSDIDIVFNKRDAVLYKKYYGEDPQYIVPLSTYISELPKSFVESTPAAESEIKKLLFVGSSYFPNMEGIRWFYENVLPELTDKIELNIVGRGTEILKNEFHDGRVHVLGTVDDVFQFLYDADIFIAPIFSGGGMKAKSVEAISFGKCIVGNDESLAGFWEEMDNTVRDSVIFNCPDAKDWITTINALAVREIKKFNRPLYDIFLNRFSYERTKKDFQDILNFREE